MALLARRAFLPLGTRLARFGRAKEDKGTHWVDEREQSPTLFNHHTLLFLGTVLWILLLLLYYGTGFSHLLTCLGVTSTFPRIPHSSSVTLPWFLLDTLSEMIDASHVFRLFNFITHYYYYYHDFFYITIIFACPLPSDVHPLSGTLQFVGPTFPQL